MGKFENTELKIWKKAFDINFYGSLYFYKNILPIMKKNKYGRIVQISGRGATAPFPMFSSYASAKAAIASLSENLSKEINKKENITINSIAPGTLNTNFTEIKLKAGPSKIGKVHYNFLKKIAKKGGDNISDPTELCMQLINGKIISAKYFDNLLNVNGIRCILSDNEETNYSYFPILVKSDHDLPKSYEYIDLFVFCVILY
jgi:3-oxoacyl-[acyl-carrier protein] reductase